MEIFGDFKTNEKQENAAYFLDLLDFQCFVTRGHSLSLPLVMIFSSVCNKENGMLSLVQTFCFLLIVG